MCDFATYVKELSAGNSYGNGVLYEMCDKDFENFNNPKHLGDKIWLIGRAYSASPERRSYGFARGDDGKAKKDDNGKRIPLHKPISAADGKGAFFSSIAEYMIADEIFHLLNDLVSELKGASYSYNESDVDILAKSIYAVAILNELVRCASEKFDGLYDDEYKQVREAEVRCKNQISFCSKFLHFHCPDTVFIIDQYSLTGGESLITYCGKKNVYIDMDKDRRYNIPSYDSLELLRDTVDFKQLLQQLKSTYEKLEKDRIIDSVKFDYCTENIENNVETYLKHCARGYVMLQYLRNQDIKATPRLVDDIFLRIMRV